MEHPSLPSDIEVLPGTDVEGEWERFEIFEALHHTMRICNPMSDADLDETITALMPRAGDRVLDLACGHGELLIRMREGAAIRAVGVDLSPWALVRAAAESRRRTAEADIQWVLGNARAADGGPFDIVTCLGASWIWHGLGGTVAAMRDRLAPGGRIAVGDLRLRDSVRLDEVIETHGQVPTADEQRNSLEQHGFLVTDRIDPGMAAWEAYQRRIDESAHAWRDDRPGPTADRYVAEQAAWRLDHARDMEVLAWTVWVARLA